MPRKFTVQRVRTLTIEEGWGVDVVPIWSEDERVVDIDVNVTMIAERLLHDIGGVPCLPVGTSGSYFVPVENFEHLEDLDTDDTHDLRTRWFATEDEAREHARYTAARFVNPQPWESFVCIGRGTR